jgi:hypothetical protein
MHLYPKLLFIALLSICLSAFQAPQKSSVKLVSPKGKIIPFKVKSQKLEWINGKLNLAILSADNKVVQVNNIDEQFLTDTTFRNKSVSFIFIDSSFTYTNNKRLLPLIEIACSEPRKGNTISLRAHGKVYYNKNWYLLTVDFSGTLPEKKFMSQYKKSSH